MPPEQTPSQQTPDQPAGSMEAGKTRRLQYWGLGSTALGVLLELAVMFLHISAVDVLVLFTGMALCGLGLVLLANVVPHFRFGQESFANGCSKTRNDLS